MVGIVRSQARSLVTPPFAHPLHLRHGVGDLVQCPLPHQMLWTEETSVYFEPYPLYNMASRCCFCQSNTRMLSRPYAAVDLEAAPSKPRSLLRCRFFPLRGFVALPLWVGTACEFSFERNSTTAWWGNDWAQFVTAISILAYIYIPS